MTAELYNNAEGEKVTTNYMDFLAGNTVRKMKIAHRIINAHISPFAPENDNRAAEAFAKYDSFTERNGMTSARIQLNLALNGIFYTDAGIIKI